MKPVMQILAAVVAGALIGIAASFTVTPQYVSSAVFQVAPHDPSVASPDTIIALWQDVVRRRNLSELIQRPTLNLYVAERQRLPLEDLMEQMKKEDLKFEVLDASVFEVLFRYPDREKARAVIQEITRQILQYQTESTGSRPFRLATAANLPGSPQSPDRLLFLDWGLGMGLLAGTLGAALWWRPVWSSKLIACGLAGAAVTAALSFFIPSQYVSKAMMRFDLSQEWFSAGGSEANGSTALLLWIDRSRAEVLSDPSLSEIIQRSSLNLYPGERERLPLEDVIRKMRVEFKIEIIDGQTQETARRRAIAISFRYPDPIKAQATLSALITKITDTSFQATFSEGLDPVNYIPQTGCNPLAFEKCGPPNFPRLGAARPESRRFVKVYLLDPASLPETTESPNRWIIALAGLGAGLWLGATNLRSS
jgi:LPS O-antigen subunit length determinant protein (WzzB/FepE family)